jgi:hypothetical protein
MEEKWQKPVPIPSIPGKVINELGEPVPFASIQTGLENYYVVADEQGIFSIQLATISNKKQLTVSSVGYETAIVSINLTDKEIIVKLKTRETVLTECFLTSTVCNYRLGGVVGAVTVMGQAIQQTLNPMNNKSESSGIPSIPSSTIKIYPNPVLSGTNISIGIKEPAEGYYSFLLINAGGQKIKQEEGWVDAEARVFNFDIPPVAAGAYFITITNKTNGKKITERIIVQ